MPVALRMTCVLGALALTASVAAAAPAYQPVNDVDTAAVSVPRTGSHNLRVTATGKVPTGGWTNGRMVRPRPMPTPDAGIYTLDFVGDAPAAATTQMVSPITAKPYAWRNYPQDLKGVKVQTSTNCVIVLLPGTDKSTIQPGTCVIQ